MKRLSLILCALITMLVSIHSEAEDSISPYADYIRKNAEDPVGFVMSKLKNYRIVAIGEDHWIADHTPFLCDVLREAARNDETRPQILAVEFGNEIDQALSDKVTHSPVFMPDSVKKILQHAPDLYGNPYEEYFGIFKCVWEINQTLPEGKKIRIVLLDPAGVQDYFDRIPSRRDTDRDMSMFKKLRQYVVRDCKIIFYAGQAHTERQIRGYKQRGRNFYYNYPSAGYLIKSSYPNDVYTIDLWAPLNMGSGYELNPKTGKWYEKCNGKFDSAFELNGNRPCAFDIHDSVWGRITMTDYFGMPGREGDYPSHPKDGNPYTEEVNLKQLTDGIVFLKPSAEFTGGRLTDIYTPDFVETCRRRSGGKLTYAESILREVNKWHPQTKMPL